MTNLCNADPDLNFYNSLNQYVSRCNYYLESTFNSDMETYPCATDVLSMCCFNIRSIKRNLTSFESYLDLLNHHFTLIGITETWLRDDDCDLYNISNYKIVENHRQNRSGGGVAFFVQKHIEYSVRHDIEIFDQECESLFIEIDKGQLNSDKTVIVGVIYRPPNTSIESFNTKISGIMDILKKENKYCYLMGDFNINILNSENHDLTGQFVDIMSSNAFLPLITRPTRITANSATLIDNIFTNNLDDIVHSVHGISVTDISDHYPIFCINKGVLIPETEEIVYKRIYSNRNKQAFLTGIQEMDWGQLLGCHGTQTCFTKFHEKLTALHNKYFPLTRMKWKYNNRKPWLSDGLKSSIKHKNKLYHIYRKMNSVYNETTYKIYKSKLQRLLKTAEKIHYQDLLLKYKDNLKKSWSIIKGIINKNKRQENQKKFKLNDGSITDNKQVISDRFNDFFVNIGPTLAKAIPQVRNHPVSFMGDRIEQSIFLEPVTEGEINQIIISLNDNAPGYDDISAMLLKVSSMYISQPLTYICNLSLQEGVFPDELKVANVIPLYKSDDVMVFNHYRPVSLLCVLSKVFEKIMYERLLKFLENLKLLYSEQYGFRRKHSTYMALLTLMDKLVNALEKKEIVVGIFLDFSKAFDTVDHDILLQKLYHYGLRGCAYSWFESYLTHRTQFVTYNGAKSKKLQIKCGVPQGSILGPLLFLIYINDLHTVCKHSFPILFADDTNLFLSGKNLDDMQTLLNEELTEIDLWLKANKLSLNIKKTHYMLFKNRGATEKDICLKIENEPITQVKKTKFLGVIIDCNLTWKEHISYISGKIAKGVGILTKARKFLNKTTLMNLYYTFVYPYLIYCNHVWGSTYTTHFNKIISLQKKAVRIIAGIKPRSDVMNAFQQLRILPCILINKYLLGRLMYKIYTNSALQKFECFFEYNKDVHGYNTRQTNHYHLPCIRTNLGKFGFRYQGAFIWNEILKLDISMESEYSFSKNLKTAILNDSLSERTWRQPFWMKIDIARPPGRAMGISHVLEICPKFVTFMVVLFAISWYIALHFIGSP